MEIMETNYGRVLITCIYDKKANGLSRTPIRTIDEYNEKFDDLNRKGGICELVGTDDCQIKPYFDLDPKGDFDYDILHEVKKDIKEVISKLTNTDVDIYEAKREAREENEVIKHSIRLYPAVRCLYSNILIIFKSVFDKYDFIDKGIYNPNRRLYCSNNDRKRDLSVPALKPIHGSVLDCCASYIKEDYPDLDQFVKVVDNHEKQPKKIDDDENKYADKKVDFLLDILNHLKIKRLDEYDSWMKVACGIIGACKKSNISERNCLNLLHQVSSMSNNYDEGRVDEWFKNNYDSQMERTSNQYAYNYLIHTCLKEDNPEYYDEHFNRNYEHIKEIFEEEVIKINDETLFIQLNKNRDIHKPESYYVKKESQLTHCYIDNAKFQYYEKVKNKKGESVNIKLSIVNQKSRWWTDCNKRKVDRLIFQPFKLDETMNKRYFNMFQGFAVENLPVKRNYECIKKILNHIKIVLCNDDDECYEWLLKLLSAMFKGRKTNVMTLFKGEDGCGKNIILDWIATKLIGDDYAISTASPEKQFFSNFNSLLQNRIMTIINEGSSGMRNCMDVIKDLITNDKINIEKKGIDAVSLSNYNNWFSTTNNHNILNVSLTDRRFQFIKCDTRFKGNKEYFDSLLVDLNNDEVKSSFYHYLIEEINCPDDYNFQLTRPLTAHYKTIQSKNISNAIIFLSTLTLEWKKYGGRTYDYIKCDEMYELYKVWAMKYKYEIYPYSGFETKITEDNKYGITKKIHTTKKHKVFEILKEPYEAIMTKINNLEDLPLLNEPIGFIQDE